MPSFRLDKGGALILVHLNLDEIEQLTDLVYPPRKRGRASRRFQEDMHNVLQNAARLLLERQEQAPNELPHCVRD